MTKKYLLVFVALIFISSAIVLIARRDWSFLTRDVRCSEKDTMKNYEFTAIVVRKYNDFENHNYNTIILKDIYNGKESKLYFINENSGFYNLVILQDTLAKTKNSLVISNITQKRDFNLLYDCDE